MIYVCIVVTEHACMRTYAVDMYWEGVRCGHDICRLLSVWVSDVAYVFYLVCVCECDRSLCVCDTQRTHAKFLRYFDIHVFIRRTWWHVYTTPISIGGRLFSVGSCMYSVFIECSTKNMYALNVYHFIWSWLMRNESNTAWISTPEFSSSDTSCEQSAPYLNSKHMPMNGKA